MKSRFLLLAAAAFLAGCSSFKVGQINRFLSDDGEFITVEYGSGDDVHKSTFISPANGKEMTFESKLRVRVEMSDGERFMAYQCMNFLRSGTMYKSSDEKWMYHANGFTCSVYLRDEEKLDTVGRPLYRNVYNGVVSQAPVKPEGR